MTHDEKPAIRELTADELRQASGGVAKIPGMHKFGDVTLKRGIVG